MKIKVPERTVKMVEVELTPDILNQVLLDFNPRIFHVLSEGTTTVAIKDLGEVHGVACSDTPEYETDDSVDAYLVFEVKFTNGETRHYRKNGYWTSYDGLFLDGELFEVVPAEKTITYWKRGTAE
jgi:hypothetical protein